MNNAKIAEAFVKQGVDPDTIDQLLSPVSIDTNRPQQVEAARSFVNQLKGIELDDLITLTNQTGMQLNYSALLPLVKRQLRKDGKRIPRKDIAELREGAQRAKREITVNLNGKNHLVLFLNKLANAFEAHNRNIQLNRALLATIVILVCMQLFMHRKTIKRALKRLLQ